MIEGKKSNNWKTIKLALKTAAKYYLYFHYKKHCPPILIFD